MNINLKKLNDKAIVPTYGTIESAGADLYACLDSDVVIKPNEVVKIGTGVSVAIPTRYVGLVFARSGLSIREGLVPANCVGVIDADYRGEIVVALHNYSNENRTINHGERIAQLVIVPFLKANFSIVKELDETRRGSGGFGSTGK